MATTSQRIFKRGKPGSFTGHRVGPGVKDHYPPHPMSSSMSPSNLPGVYSNPDMAYALVAIVGCVVDVKMRSGVSYQGVLKAVSSKLSVALAMAHDKDKEASSENTAKLMQLEFADIVSVSVLPDLNPSLTSKDIFKTDAEISRSNGSGLSKELQPFAFDEDSNANITLHDKTGGWTAEDMFETNKSKFNVESSFDEELADYTTKLDRSDKDFKEREERAEKLAREIEDNGDSPDDVGTEEELFSAVVRQEAAPPPSSVSKTVSKHSSSTHSHQSQPNQPQQYNHHPNPLHSTSGGLTERHSYSAAVNTPELRLAAAAKASDLASTNSSSQSQGGGTNSSLSQTYGSSSQEFHQVHSADMDSMNTRSGWTSQESALGLSEENSFVEKCSQESAGQATLDEEEIQDITIELHAESNTEDEEVVSPAVPPGLGIRTEGETGIEPSTETAEDTEKRVKKFQLNPNAKSYSLNPAAAVFVPSSSSLSASLPLPGSPLTQSSSSPAMLDSSSYQSPNYHGKKFKRVHTNTPLYTTQEYPGYMSGGYVYSPTQQVPVSTTTFIRNPFQQMPNQQMIQYSSSMPQFTPGPTFSTAGGYISAQPQAVTTPQYLLNSGQKFISEMSPQHQVFAGTQQYSMHNVMNHHQLLQQQQQQSPLHGQMMLGSASQPQLTTTPGAGGLVSTPPPVMLVQSGGVSPQGPNPPGGMYSHVQVAGVMPQTGQNQVMTSQSRYVHSAQQPPN